MDFEKGEMPEPLCWRCKHWSSFYPGRARAKYNGYCELHEMGWPRSCTFDGDWADFEPYDEGEDREAILKEWRAWDQYCRDLEQLELEKALGIVQEF